MSNRIKNISSPKPGKDTSVVAKLDSGPLGPVETGFKRFELTKLSRTTSELVEAKTETDYEISIYTVSTACVQTSLEEENPALLYPSRAADSGPPYPSHVRVKLDKFRASIFDEAGGGWETDSTNLANRVIDDVEFDSFLDDYTEAVDSNVDFEHALVQLLNAVFGISRRYDDPDQDPALKIKFLAQKPEGIPTSRPVCIAVAQMDDLQGRTLGWNDALMLLDIQDSWDHTRDISSPITEEREVLDLVNRTGVPNDIASSYRDSSIIGNASSVNQGRGRGNFASAKRKRPHNARSGPIGTEPPPKRQRRTHHLFTKVPADNPEQSSPKLDQHHASHAPSAAMATDALEALSVLGNRRHVLGISIRGLAARFWYFDRAGSVSTQEFQLSDIRFVHTLLALRFATPYQLGFEPCFRGPPQLMGRRSADEGLSKHENLAAHLDSNGDINMNPQVISSDCEQQEQTWSLFDTIVEYRIDVQGRAFALDRVLHTTSCLYGRGTVTYLARPLPVVPQRNQEGASFVGGGPSSSPASHIPDEVVLKLSWLPASWPDENEPLRLAQEAGVQGVATLYASRVVTRLSRGVRGRMVDDIEQYRDRELRIQIIGPVCVPLHSILDEQDHFKKAFISLVKAHRQLYERAGVLHRDISLNNLMVEASDHGAGILIDLDIAQWTRAQTQGNNADVDTTSLPLPGGTVAFRAVDLCQDEPLPRHLYRHDLESFFYVLVWMVANFQDQGQQSLGPDEEDAEPEQLRSLLSRWHKGDWTDIKASKEQFLQDLSGKVLTGQTVLSQAWLPALQTMFRAGYGAKTLAFPGDRDGGTIRRADAPWMSNLLGYMVTTGGFDDDTLSGHVTYDKFIAILEDEDD